MEKHSFLIAVIFLWTTCQDVCGRTQTVTIQDLCGTTVDKADALRLRSHDSVEAFNGDQLMPRCTFVLQALKTNQGFLIQFDEYFILEDATGPQRAANTADNITEIIPSYCNSSFLQIWEGDDVTDDVEPIMTACGTVVPDVVVESRTQFVTLRLTVHPTARVNITVLATSFDTGPCTDEVTELRCRNGRCVPRTLRCDNADNCGDNTDQLVSAPANCTLATIKGTVDFPSEILLGSLAAILVAFGLYWLFWRPGYVIWRLACCRNLARCCCHRCSCRKTTFCCHPIRCFGGSCHGNGENEKKSQQSSKSLADDSSKESGPLTRSDGPCTDEVTELRCRNGRCVPRTLRCDNADICGDNTDQLVSAPANCTLATIKGTVDFPSEILLGSLAAILVAFGLYWLFWRPGYVIWRLACCRNLARCCCHRCSCRKTTFCCHPIRCFGGSCHGNGEDEKKSQQSSKSLADDSSKESGPLTRSDGKRGGIENVSTRGERKGCIFCPCGRGGGRQDLKDSGEHDRREGGGWKGQEVNENMYDNGGDGGHARECR
ncbi:uncharacterized protein [Asterias amurensis]|uniref:uncharacterized protein n=1 Tax=Asterias amurensis TaxID=7602 RepID=UPI003AB7AB41